MTKRKKGKGWRAELVTMDEATEAHFSDEPLPQSTLDAVAEQPAIIAPRQLAYCHGAPERHAGVMILIDDTPPDIVEVARYRCQRMWHRVQRYGQWWRLQGQDRATGECIYTKEIDG